MNIGNSSTTIQGKTIVVSLIIILLAIVGLMFGLPMYNVWRAEQAGKAEFSKAEQNRRIKIEEAKANLEAEKLNAKAEIERAKGAAEAIRYRKQQPYAYIHSVSMGASAGQPE